MDKRPFEEFDEVVREMNKEHSSNERSFSPSIKMKMITIKMDFDTWLEKLFKFWRS